MEHTPLPWKRNGSYFGNAEEVIGRVLTGEKLIAYANAEFIVMACNNFYELLEACKMALELAEMFVKSDDEWLENKQKIEQALVKATEEKLLKV